MSTEPSIQGPPGFKQVGELTRTETDELIVGYTFDLTKNTLSSKTVPNPDAGEQHLFSAWRLEGELSDPVTMIEDQVGK